VATSTGFARQKFSGGAVRAEIQHSAAALAIFRPKVRNDLARSAMTAAGNAWITTWLPQRFTPYVLRSPFGYGKRKGPWLATKLRTAEAGTSGVADAWKRIKARDFDGWDPWSTSPPPASLEKKWIDRNPNKYRLRGLGSLFLGDAARMRADLRKWAKARVREYAENMQSDGVINPLVASGKLRDTYSKTARPDVTATTKKLRMTIVIPRADRVSKTVGRVLGTLPYWEADFIAKNFIANFREMIRDGTIKYVDAKVARFTARQAGRNDRMESRKMAAQFRRKQSTQAALIAHGHD
jgi:hypothetical protein